MSWPMVKIGSCIEKVKSWNPLKSANTDSFLYIDLSSVDKDKKELDQNSVVSILPSEAPSRARQLVRANDVLVSTVRPNLNGVALVTDNYCGATASTGYCVLRANAQKLDSRFLFYWVQTQSFISDMVKKATGANYPAVSDKIIMDSEIPLPPLADQKRIAAILDKADAIRRKRQQAIQLADDFLRAVFLEMFGDPVTNPKGWEVKLLKDIAKIQIGPFGTQLHKEDYISDGIPLINPSHIKNSEVVPDFNLTVSEQKFAELGEYHLEVGDIIMGRRGEMGRCALIGEREAGWLCGTGSLYIRPFVSNAQSFYLFKYLTSDYIKTYLEGESLGATMPNLNKAIVGNIKVPMPSTKAITKFQEVLAADSTYREKITLIDDSLFESLSQKAFSGQL